MRTLRIFLFLFIAHYYTLYPQRNSIHWDIHEFLCYPNDSVHRVGSPSCIHTEFGAAVYFNGSTDGIFISKNPLIGLTTYTVEVLFYPDTGGSHEQRFLHFGELRGNRTLLEIRLFDTLWALDAYVKSDTSARTLLDTTRLHPTRLWHHVALVVDSTSMATYVNGHLELTAQLHTLPQHSGSTSIGVRLNRQYWFRGAIASIVIHSKALLPFQFTLLKQHDQRSMNRY